MPFTADSHVRIARPSRDLARAERFWTEGLGLSVPYRADSGGAPAPTAEDLLVVYLDEAVPEELVARLVAHGGERVSSPNPYGNTWGVTVEDPDGYRLVLCRRSWSNGPRG